MAKKKNGAGNSLQDQLRAVGLVSEKQLRKAKKGLHRKEMRVKQGVEVDEDKIVAQKLAEDKSAKDLEINKARDAQIEKRSIAAQIKQLIEMNSQRQAGDIAYNFTQENKIKKIYISEENKNQLNKGYLAIVASQDGFDIVPEKVAQKIKQRSEDAVLYLFERNQRIEDEDDPYKDFQIPDDLEW